MSDETFQDMLVCEHGGMCEVMGELFLLTQDEKYLFLAKWFTPRVVVELLGRFKDEL